MAKIYVFGIGGTGARVLRSLTMMLASGVQLGQDEIVPIFIDPDESNADLSRTVDLMNLYIRIHRDLTFPSSNKNRFFRTAIDQVVPGFRLQIRDTDDKSFQKFMDVSTMNRENQALVKLLFSESNLRSKMDVGFKGNPNIGSVVLNQIVNSDDFETFANGFSVGDKIFIISSIFGGTGASGFPLLLKTLRTGKDFPNFQAINDAEIGAVTVLPYFKLKQSDESEIDSSSFISKTKSALAYYEDNISKNNQINALYYLGDNVQNTYENYEGGVEQKNDAHLIEFLAATAIIDFSKTTCPTTVNKELGIKDGGVAVSFTSFYDEITSMLRKPLTQFVLMSNCFKHAWGTISTRDLAANGKVPEFTNDLYQTQFVCSLKDFQGRFLDWLAEMKRNKRSLDLFNLECGSKPFDVVTNITPRKVKSLKSNYSLFVDRINGQVSKLGSKEAKDKLLEIYYLATKQLVTEKFDF